MTKTKEHDTGISKANNLFPSKPKSRLIVFTSTLAVPILAVFLMSTQTLWMSDGPCKNDNIMGYTFGVDHTKTATTASGEDIYQIDPCHVFSETYPEARVKFRKAATAAGAQLQSIVVHQEEEESVNAMNYTMDVAIIPATDKSDGRLVVHTSGVHGIEGYAGSAIQVAYLEKLQHERQQQQQQKQHERINSDSESSARAPGTRPTIILIHAVNPYGMAHYRRVNEENVDLNRNGLTDFSVATGRDPNVAHYDDFTQVYNPQDRTPTRYHGYIGIWFSMVGSLFQYGLVYMKRSMVAGQYHFKEGIFYGGTELQSSLKILVDLITAYKESGKEANLYATSESHEEEKEHLGSPTSTTQQVTWIDVHTGLGKSGHDTLIICREDDELGKKAQQSFPGATIAGQGSGKNAVSEGYDLTMGTVCELMEPLFASTRSKDAKNDVDGSHTSSAVLSITQEFGTLPSILVGRALILENMAFQYFGCDNVPEWIRDIFRAAFYQRNSRWRRSILSRGLAVLEQAILR